MKKVLLFLSGVIVGIFATILFATISSQDDGFVKFEEPGEMITLSPLKIMQVLDEGVALAEEYKNGYANGLLVLLVSKDEYFYDDQIVYLSEKECFKQIGVYTYVTKSGIEKTVPVVEALNY